jgi:hypothetical protein
MTGQSRGLAKFGWRGLDREIIGAAQAPFGCDLACWLP